MKVVVVVSLKLPLVKEVFKGKSLSAYVTKLSSILVVNEIVQEKNSDNVVKTLAEFKYWEYYRIME